MAKLEYFVTSSFKGLYEIHSTLHVSLSRFAKCSSNDLPIFQGCMLELTDGWYSIPAAIDLPLTSLVHQGRIRVGDKLCVFGAEFLGNPEPAPPLQVFVCPKCKFI